MKAPTGSFTLCAPFRPRKGDRRRGNCYYITEALFHILGGRAMGWRSMRLVAKDPVLGDCSHWYLQHESGVIVDASRMQFRAPGWYLEPDYSTGRGAGFLTKQPSKRAARLMVKLTWAILPDGSSTC